MDTNVLLGALWSQRGAAHQVLEALRRGRWRIVLSNHLLLEYEEVCKRHAAEMGMTLEEIDDVLDAICLVAEERALRPGWVPQLSDPDDEPMLQLAVESAVPDIVTRNIRHLRPALAFGIHVLSPAEFLNQINQTP